PYLIVHYISVPSSQRSEPGALLSLPHRPRALVTGGCLEGSVKRKGKTSDAHGERDSGDEDDDDRDDDVGRMGECRCGAAAAGGHPVRVADVVRIRGDLVRARPLRGDHVRAHLGVDVARPRRARDSSAQRYPHREEAGRSVYRILMVICYPVAYPLGKILDYALGHSESALFRRAQLKVLVSIHSKEVKLSSDILEYVIRVAAAAAASSVARTPTYKRLTKQKSAVSNFMCFKCRKLSFYLFQGPLLRQGQQSTGFLRKSTELDPNTPQHQATLVEPISGTKR
ncbi:hypothetical protein B296_00043178, partial [Ensete ventricosum]